MIGRTIRIGVSIAAALLACGVATQSAGAAAAGTTAFACTELATETGHFVREHCRPGLNSLGQGDEGTGKFEHEVIKEGARTGVKLTDTTTGGVHTGFILKSTVVGSAIEVVSKEVHAIDTLENSVDAESKEHYVHGEGTISFTGVTENLLGCEVTGLPGGAGAIETKQLKYTSTGQGMNIKYEAKEGTVLAEFELTGCVIAPIKVKLVGSVLGVPNGATINFTHNIITTQKTLRLQNAATGPLVGVEGTFTTTGMLFETKDPTSPVSFTTVETK